MEKILRPARSTGFPIHLLFRKRLCVSLSSMMFDLEARGDMVDARRPMKKQCIEGASLKAEIPLADGRLVHHSAAVFGQNT